MVDSTYLGYFSCILQLHSTYPVTAIGSTTMQAGNVINVPSTYTNVTLRLSYD